MTTQTNQRIVLAARPDGVPQDKDFKLVSEPIGVPADKEILCETVYMSLDPYMRAKMNTGKSYSEPLEIGDTMCGGTVSRVLASNDDNFVPGDFVLTYDGWQSFAVSEGKYATKLNPDIAPLSTALGVLGMPGMTAYMGLLKIGNPKPGETVVVAAASGAVGSVVGQIARLKGCNVVGIAGSERKCNFVIDELGFDHCINYKDVDFPNNLKQACAKGIDIYFENVAGDVLTAVIPLLNFKARIPVCGLIAHYNDSKLPDGPNLLPKLMTATLIQRLLIQGFIVTDFDHKRQTFLHDMSGWLASGEIQFKEDIITGLENAVSAFQGLLQGDNFGKLLVQLSDDPTRI